MQPSMLLKLLRKLTVDVSNLSEYTTVALRVCIFTYMFHVDLKLMFKNMYIVSVKSCIIVVNFALRSMCKILWINRRSRNLRSF